MTLSVTYHAYDRRLGSQDRFGGFLDALMMQMKNAYMMSRLRVRLFRGLYLDRPGGQSFFQQRLFWTGQVDP